MPCSVRKRLQNSYRNGNVRAVHSWMGRPMDFKTFFQGLDDEQQQRFAEAAKAKVGYIRTHLIYARKMPKALLMNRLAHACEQFGSGISRGDLFEFFYSNAERGGETASLKPAGNPVKRSRPASRPHRRSTDPKPAAKAAAH